MPAPRPSLARLSPVLLVLSAWLGACTSSPSTRPTDAIDPPADTDDEACPAGTTSCDGTCADLLTDPDHCGTCSNDCGDPTYAEASCVAGECALTCDAGTLPCVDGDCTPCPANAAVVECEASRCVAKTCEPGFELCGGECQAAQGASWTRCVDGELQILDCEGARFLGAAGECTCPPDETPTTTAETTTITPIPVEIPAVWECAVSSTTGWDQATKRFCGDGDWFVRTRLPRDRDARSVVAGVTPECGTAWTEYCEAFTDGGFPGLHLVNLADGGCGMSVATTPLGGGGAVRFDVYGPYTADPTEIPIAIGADGQIAVPGERVFNRIRITRRPTNVEVTFRISVTLDTGESRSVDARIRRNEGATEVDLGGYVSSDTTLGVWNYQGGVSRADLDAVITRSWAP